MNEDFGIPKAITTIIPSYMVYFCIDGIPRYIVFPSSLVYKHSDIPRTGAYRTYLRIRYIGH